MGNGCKSDQFTKREYLRRNERIKPTIKHRQTEKPRAMQIRAGMHQERQVRGDANKKVNEVIEINLDMDSDTEVRCRIKIYR